MLVEMERLKEADAAAAAQKLETARQLVEEVAASNALLIQRRQDAAEAEALENARIAAYLAQKDLREQVAGLPASPRRAFHPVILPSRPIVLSFIMPFFCSALSSCHPSVLPFFRHVLSSCHSFVMSFHPVMLSSCPFIMSFRPVLSSCHVVGQHLCDGTHGTGL